MDKLKLFDINAERQDTFQSKDQFEGSIRRLKRREFVGCVL
jgi:hypothetical protein